MCLENLGLGARIPANSPDLGTDACQCRIEPLVFRIDGFGGVSGIVNFGLSADESSCRTIESIAVPAGPVSWVRLPSRTRQGDPRVDRADRQHGATQHDRLDGHVT